MNGFDPATQTALKKITPAEAGHFSSLMNTSLVQTMLMPPKPHFKEVLVALLMDKSILGGAIDAKIAEAVKKAPSSSGINASSVDSKISKALEDVKGQIDKAVEGHLTAANVAKMRLAPASGGGRRGTKRGKRGSKRAKRSGTKRR
jgi:hypothetical protein